MKNSIKLQTDSVLHVPFNKYTKDFTFIVNSERYKTSSFYADLLSPIISSRHIIDPTLSEFVINTRTQGDFKKLLSLDNFKTEPLESEEVPFFIELLEKLGAKTIDFKLDVNTVEITNSNVFNLIKQHQKNRHFFNDRLFKEIEYASRHFFELSDNILELVKSEEDEKEENSIIEDIISHAELQLESEDQLLKFVNELYRIDHNYGHLYEFVFFENASIESMKEFTAIFDMNDLTNSSWNSIIARLQRDLKEDESSERIHKYIKKFFTEIETKENEFDGILNYLQTHSNIKNEINITASSYGNGNVFNILQFENKNSFFITKSEPNSWICIEFKNHQIIPSSYTIRSSKYENSHHLKSWVLEGSNDNSKWLILDEQKNNKSLKGCSLVHTFNIQNSNCKQESFKFLRIRQTGPSWYDNNDDDHCLLIYSIEFYGKFI